MSADIRFPLTASEVLHLEGKLEELLCRAAAKACARVIEAAGQVRTLGAVAEAAMTLLREDGQALTLTVTLARATPEQRASVLRSHGQEAGSA